MGESGSLVSQASGKISHVFFFSLKKRKEKTKKKIKEQLPLSLLPAKNKKTEHTHTKQQTTLYARCTIFTLSQLNN